MVLINPAAESSGTGERSCWGSQPIESSERFESGT